MSPPLPRQFFGFKKMSKNLKIKSVWPNILKLITKLTNCDLSL